MRNSERPSRRWLLALVAALLIVALAGYAASWIPGALLPMADPVAPGVALDEVQITEERLGGHHLAVAPANQMPDTLFVLYPGGLVRPHAYVWLGVALAPYGVRTVIPVMPMDLAVLAPNRAEALVERYGDVERVIIGGHSLGGAMAARYVHRSGDDSNGLLLMASFSAEGDDLSQRELPTLVLAAEHDGLATLAEVRSGMQRLPADAQLDVVAGAVHAFFGRYGPQAGDGEPVIARADAEADIVASIVRFLDLELPISER